MIREMDEEALQELFEGDLDSEVPLDFSEDHVAEHMGGHIYESIEDEVSAAVEEASVDYDEDEEMDRLILAIQESKEPVEVSIKELFPGVDLSA